MFLNISWTSSTQLNDERLAAKCQGFIFSQYEHEKIIQVDVHNICTTYTVVNVHRRWTLVIYSYWITYVRTPFMLSVVFFIMNIHFEENFGKTLCWLLDQQKAYIFSKILLSTTRNVVCVKTNSNSKAIDLLKLKMGLWLCCAVRLCDVNKHTSTVAKFFILKKKLPAI